MTTDWIRRYCLTLPGATEHIQWGNDLVFKVAGKMFAVTPVEPSAGAFLSFKVTPEEFLELTERPDIIPAPYLARAQWVALTTPRALSPSEYERLLRGSYNLVVARLPRKVRLSLPTEM